jgi:hypothetical protein
MKIYLDDDSADRRLVAFLRNAGHEVTVPMGVGGAGGNDRRRDLTPRGIAAAVSKLELSGLAVADGLHSVNQWR